MKNFLCLRTLFSLDTLVSVFIHKIMRFLFSLDVLTLCCDSYLLVEYVVSIKTEPIYPLFLTCVLLKQNK